jgi:cell division control protein 42
VPDINLHYIKKPLLLVGLKCDFHDDVGSERLIKSELSEKVAKEIKAVTYLECLTLTQARRHCHTVHVFVLQKGVKIVFDEAISWALESPSRMKMEKFSI